MNRLEEFFDQSAIESADAQRNFLGDTIRDFLGNPAGYGALMRRNGQGTSAAHLAMRGTFLGGSPAGILGATPMRTFLYHGEG